MEPPDPWNYTTDSCGNESTRLDLGFVRTWCLDSHPTPDWCYPANIPETFSTIAGVLCAVNALFGFSGNLLTLLAIPYATRRKK